MVTHSIGKHLYSFDLIVLDVKRQMLIIIIIIIIINFICIAPFIQNNAGQSA